MADPAVNIHEAKTHFSRLVERAEAGEEIVIARAGVPVARLVPLVEISRRRIAGVWRGAVSVPDDFDAPDPEIEALFGDVP
jgi:prevent-host-death family protein